jgi:hypothetical protein
MRTQTRHPKPNTTCRLALQMSNDAASLAPPGPGAFGHFIAAAKNCMLPPLRPPRRSRGLDVCRPSGPNPRGQPKPRTVSSAASSGTRFARGLGILVPRGATFRVVACFSRFAGMEGGREAPVPPAVRPRKAAPRSACVQEHAQLEVGVEAKRLGRRRRCPRT